MLKDLQPLLFETKNKILRHFFHSLWCRSRSSIFSCWNSHGKCPTSDVFFSDHGMFQPSYMGMIWRWPWDTDQFHVLLENYRFGPVWYTIYHQTNLLLKGFLEKQTSINQPTNGNLEHLWYWPKLGYVSPVEEPNWNETTHPAQFPVEIWGAQSREAPVFEISSLQRSSARPSRASKA